MECFDLYSEHRQQTGETLVRGTQTPAGRYRLVVHICIFNSNGELLIQQRQPFKKGWSNLWDVTVGGAVTAGETSQQGAHRELLEELGLDVDFEGSVPAFTSTFQGGFDDIYLLRRDVDISELQLQPEEVQAAKWAGKDEILAMIDNKTFIPYSKAFMEYLFFRSGHWGNFDTDQ